MTIPDETLMTYVDGELEATAVADVESAMAQDPSVARRVDAWRKQRLCLRAAYDDVLREPVPARLAAAVEGVRSLRPARSRPGPRWELREMAAMAAMAASVLLGALLTWSVVRQPEPVLMLVSGEGLVAGSALARSLSEDLAGDLAAGPVRVGLSFRDRAGAYCRTFVLTDGPAPAGPVTAGLACRVEDHWQVQLAVPAGAGGRATGYRQAGSALPEEILRAVDARIEGEALGPEAERAARVRGWTD